MPGSFINLLPPDLTKPKVSSAASQATYRVPESVLPKFGPPPHLVPDNFWSNLKQFLIERPIKVIDRAGAPFRPPAYGGGFGENLREFFRSAPVSRTAGKSRLEVNWNAGFGGFGQRLKEAFFPAKLPPLQVTSKLVKVKDIWTKDTNFGWTQAISVGLHGALIALLVVPIFTNMLPQTTQANTKPGIGINAIDISPYVAKLPAGNDKAGGGGGGGDRSPLPPTKGRAPRFAMTQFTPPSATIKNQNPKLAMDPTLLGPPDLKVMNPALSNYGDPLAALVNNSGGPGGGSGIGTGCCGGIGSGDGAGLGPGSGGGTGGGAFRAGVNGVGIPSCLYCPDPQYSEEARKAKYQGTVVLQVIITADGRATNIQVVKGPGLGLEEKAIEAVRGWKFRPAIGPSGKAVPVIVPIEVTFRLF